MVTDQPQPSKLCPLLSAGAGGRTAYCVGPLCSWWDDRENCCIVLVLGRGKFLASRGPASVPASAHHEEMTPQAPPQPPAKKGGCQDCEFFRPSKYPDLPGYCRRYRYYLGTLKAECDGWVKREESASRAKA